jgi:hypothetical protein
MKRHARCTLTLSTQKRVIFLFCCEEPFAAWSLKGMRQLWKTSIDFLTLILKTAKLSTSKASFSTNNVKMPLLR